MPACPYCENNDIQLYYYAKLPFFIWPLTPGEKNFMVTVEVYLCTNCWYAFNINPLSEEYIKKLYDDYYIAPPAHKHYYSPHSEFFKLVKGNIKSDDRIIEIGPSNGYLLTLLYVHGYEYLEEAKPERRIDGNLSLRVVDDFSIGDEEFGSEIDVFLLDNVFEHLEKPWEFLEMISNGLSKDGRIIMEFPGYCSCMHHQHVSFFTLPFLQTISQECGLIMNVAFHDHSTVTRVIFQKRGNCGKLLSLDIDELEKEKELILQNTQKISQDFINNKSKLNNFLKNASGGEIYWWGTDMWAASLFSYIDQDLLNENLKIKYIDSDNSKEGLIFFPAKAEVFSAEKVLKNANIKYLVIASKYEYEMAKLLKEWNCNAESIFHV